MRGVRILRSSLTRFLVLARTHFDSSHSELTPVVSATIETGFKELLSSRFSIPFSTSSFETPTAPKTSKSPEAYSSDGDDDDDDENDYDNDNDDIYSSDVRQLNLTDEVLVQDVNTIMSLLQQRGDNFAEMRNKIEHCGVKASQELVLEVLSRVRNDWEAAFTFFLWAGRQPGYTHSIREYHAMIAILGKMKKFDTAWALIDEMRGVKTGISLVSPQTLMIMIRRYCAVHDVGRAINTFYVHKRFKFDVGMEEFQGLLSALCRYKNVQDAEYLMFCNKNVFPFNTKSFNIILNGWCNVIGSTREAERVWKEMCRRGIRYDVVSYSSIISCYSKAGNLYKALNLYEHMKRMGIEPDRKVYNAVIHALAKGRLVKESISLMKTMEKKGIAPNVVTYNSLIKPLCKARKIDEARGVFDEMLERGLCPTIRTYHAFFRILRTMEEVFALLEKMRKMGCQPTSDTYIMLIRKFCRWRQLDNVFRLWNDMKENGISPNCSSYTVLIHGLFLNGKLEEAYKYYMDMTEKQLLAEPKIEGIIQTWLSNKQIADCQMEESEGKALDHSQSSKQTFISRKIEREKDFLRQAETRRVVRERGFSLQEK